MRRNLVSYKRCRISRKKRLIWTSGRVPIIGMPKVWYLSMRGRRQHPSQANSSVASRSIIFRLRTFRIFSVPIIFCDIYSNRILFWYWFGSQFYFSKTINSISFGLRHCKYLCFSKLINSFYLMQVQANKMRVKKYAQRLRNFIQLF